MHRSGLRSAARRSGSLRDAGSPRAPRLAVGCAVLIGLVVMPFTAAGADGAASDEQAAGAVGALRSATLPPIGAHFVWVVDAVFLHSQLYDGDTGVMLATIDGGTTISPKPPLHGPRRGEIYSVEIDYDRGKRGRRTDYVTIHDAKTLAVKGDIVFPTRAGESAASLGYSAMLDDERFLAVFNQFPVTSVSIIDLERRAFVGEVPAAGCAGIYPTGARSYAMLCGDGTLHHFRLDDDGRLAGSQASARFFDPIEDPATLAAARIGSGWFFPTFAGQIHAVDFASGEPAIESWWMTSESERAAGWRPGGRQLIAGNPALGRLYVLFHQGGPGSHKDPGPEVWVFDASAADPGPRRVARFELPNFTAAFLADMTGMGSEGFGPWLLAALLPDDGADTVAVTRDAEPLLFLRHSERGTVAVLDAVTGEHLRSLSEVGLGGTRLQVP